MAAFSSPLTAARISRLRMAPAVTFLLCRHPLQVAEAFALPDLLSDRRVDFAAAMTVGSIQEATGQFKGLAAASIDDMILDFNIGGQDYTAVMDSRDSLPERCCLVEAPQDNVGPRQPDAHVL